MGEKIRSLRGTRDILPEEASKWQFIERVSKEVAESYGYGELRTPIIESTALFNRSVGDTSDIVQKEMYTFEKGERSISLRPEGTAGAVRAVLQNGMLNEAMPLKLFYNISCYRYERPQAGRQREFHQFGAECLGAPDPTQDAELIAMIDDLLGCLGVTGVELEINSIGCDTCRPAYHKALVDYYRQHEEELCEDCTQRLEKNPLRLLDCKEEGCRPIKAGAPKMIDYLCEDCQEHFTGLQTNLNAIGIPYRINPEIVRGLDYYTRTVFEFITTQIGAQGTICGGGRYDKLVEQLGGAPTPALGFAIGIERLLLVMEACKAEFPPTPNCALYIGSMGKEAATKALELACKLRSEGFYVLCDTMGRSVRSQMKYADKKQAGFSCILGEEELSQGEVEINNMETGDKTKVKLDSEVLSNYLWSQIQDQLISGQDPLDHMLEHFMGEEH